MNEITMGNTKQEIHNAYVALVSDLAEVKAQQDSLQDQIDALELQNNNLEAHLADVKLPDTAQSVVQAILALPASEAFALFIAHYSNVSLFNRLNAGI